MLSVLSFILLAQPAESFARSKSASECAVLEASIKRTERMLTFRVSKYSEQFGTDKLSETAMGEISEQEKALRSIDIISGDLDSKLLGYAKSCFSLNQEKVVAARTTLAERDCHVDEYFQIKEAFDQTLLATVGSIDAQSERESANITLIQDQQRHIANEVNISGAATSALKPLNVPPFVLSVWGTRHKALEYLGIASRKIRMDGLVQLARAEAVSLARKGAQLTPEMVLNTANSTSAGAKKFLVKHGPKIKKAGVPLTVSLILATWWNANSKRRQTALQIDYEYTKDMLNELNAEREAIFNIIEQDGNYARGTCREKENTNEI